MGVVYFLFFVRRLYSQDYIKDVFAWEYPNYVELTPPSVSPKNQVREI